jgi:assimilatory nitrate reductase catalytic subunit
MTRTGKSPRLSVHMDEPFVEVHPDDAAAAGLDDGGFACVFSLHGSVVLRVRCSEGQRRGELFAPIHWNAQNASDGRIGALVHPSCDPHSGQPDMKATPASIAPARFSVQGFLLSRASVALPQGFWWARAAVEGCTALRFAANAPEQEWAELAHRLFGSDGAIIEFHDNTQKVYRAAHIRNDRLEACLWLAAGHGSLPGWDWLKQRLAEPRLDELSRRALLAGRPPDGVADTGPVVCACFGVGLAAIQALIACGVAGSVEAVGQHLRAGTNCGSCQPEIKKLITAMKGASVLETAT